MLDESQGGQTENVDWTTQADPEIAALYQETNTTVNKSHAVSGNARRLRPNTWFTVTPIPAAAIIC